MRLALVLFAASIILRAQSSPAETPRTITNFGSWYMYNGDHPIAGRWGVHLEGQYRRYDVITKWKQLLLRAAPAYTVNKHLRIAAGYTYLRTYAFLPNPAPGSNENRIYEEALIHHTFRRSDWVNRFRLEQRFVAPRVPGPKNWSYANRFRYQLETHIPIHQRPSTGESLYLALYDEVYASFGAHTSQVFNQNRVYVALGIHLGKTNSLEIGYMNQYFPQSNGFDQNNNILHVTVVSKTPFRRQKTNTHP